MFNYFRDQTQCVKSVQIRSFFWSVFSCILIEYGDYGYFSRSNKYLKGFLILVLMLAIVMKAIPKSIFRIFKNYDQRFKIVYQVLLKLRVKSYELLRTS